MIGRTIFLLATLAGVAFPAGGDQRPTVADTARHGSPPFLEETAFWADSVMSTLSLDERIAQLLMVAAYSDGDKKEEAKVMDLVKEHNVGGLIFFKGGPDRQAKLTNAYQLAAKTPLLIGMDLEWGLAMRLDSTIQFPKQMTLGAQPNEALIEKMGMEIAREMKRLGVHVSFSPVADVNNNINNPVINYRSFGEDRDNVARKAIAYMRGLQRGGVIATAKHFPGHGDTDVDSHKALPVIAHTRTRLDSLELYPFQKLVDEGLSAMMVAHLEVPALDSTPGLPSTLSAPIVEGILEKEFGFKGLVFTDALNMRGVADAKKPGEIELLALKAGNDVLLFPQDPIKAIQRIRKAVDEGELASEVIDHKCLKVLRAKQWAKVTENSHVHTENLFQDLNTNEALVLRSRLYEASMTVVNNDKDIIPVRKLGSLRIASVVIGDEINNTFQQSLSRYAPITKFNCSKNCSGEERRKLIRQLREFDLVIASVHGTSNSPSQKFGVPITTDDLIRDIDKDNDLIHVHFGNPYRLGMMYNADLIEGLIVAYEDDPDAHEMAAQLIFGATYANGTLPVSAGNHFQAGQGFTTQPLQRLRYTLPEGAEVRSSSLARIDSIIQEGLDNKAYPGCQLAVVVNGKVIMDRAYGKHTYDGPELVKVDDLYDIASITKIAATTVSLMKLVGDGKLDLDADLGTYLTELNGAHEDYARLKFRDILTHQAGLVGWIPFYTKLIKDGSPKPGIVSEKMNASHTLRVTERVYIDSTYRDSINSWILSTPVREKKKYWYSDLGYYFMIQVIERITEMPLDQYVQQKFYGPLGLATMGYHPMQHVDRKRIIPTEYDAEFRQQLIWGDVHDPGAAMMGGVGGHAGLFSDANDLAILMQMLMNKGTYGGTRFLNEEVVSEFTKCQYCENDIKENRRGLGFDKPVRDGEGGPTCQCVSYASFGHSGFTGTIAWADPVHDVIYVFLSNRIYPTALNKKLIRMNIRTRIQEVIHEAIAERD